MHIQMHIDDYQLVLQALRKLQKENKMLKSQIEAEKFHSLISNVANRIDHWMNAPYYDISEQQDIKNFAEEITKYIDSQLRT